MSNPSNKSDTTIVDHARVCRATRRYVDVYTAEYQLVRGRVSPGVEALCVGDYVSLSACSTTDCIVSGKMERKNLLCRSSTVKTKLLAANIDHLYIVTAPGAICKPQTIDRVIIAALAEEIPVSIIWNKCDIEKEMPQAVTIQAAYQKAGFSIFTCSAISGVGIEAVKAHFSQKAFSHVVLTGVSGVGKSTLLNTLLESAAARTQSVSERSGYGRQTTSEAYGYLLPRADAAPLMLCDLPGVQQFGLAHLEESSIRAGYPEFASITETCRFNNCSHIEEPDCAVRHAVEMQQLDRLRYTSYTQILSEQRMQYY